jgi:hypothetical protein
LPVSSSVLMLLPPDKCHSEMSSRSVITRPGGLTEQSGAAAATPLLEESARPLRPPDPRAIRGALP